MKESVGFTDVHGDGVVPSVRARFLVLSKEVLLAVHQTELPEPGVEVPGHQETTFVNAH